MVLYPVLVHMYLRLIYNGHEEKAISLLQRFSLEQEDYYQSDLKKLSTIIKKEHMESNELSQNFKYVNDYDLTLYSINKHQNL